MKRKGFTLIEVILSMAIIGIIAVSTLTMLNSSLLNIKRAGNRTTAVEQTERLLINKVNEEEIYFSVELKSIDGSTSIMSSSGLIVNKINGTVPIEQTNGGSVELEIYESFR